MAGINHVEEDRMGLRAWPPVHQVRRVRQTPHPRQGLRPLRRLHAEDDPGRRLMAARLGLHPRALPAALSHRKVEAPEPRALYGEVVGMEGDQQFAQGSPEAYHCTDVESQGIRLFLYLLAEALVHATARVALNLPAPGFAVPGGEPGDAEPKKGQGCEGCGCKVLGHCKGTKEGALALPTRDGTEEAILIHQPTLGRHAPERKAAEACS
mmetsp:Transcript_55901/g.179417  ORF Transcript_55901/g.179417 Transcript_55901/m.179417 type:complete len:210 (+) Transcript_55901:163-792(+)